MIQLKSGEAFIMRVIFNSDVVCLYNSRRSFFDIIIRRFRIVVAGLRVLLAYTSRGALRPISPRPPLVPHSAPENDGG